MSESGLQKKNIFLSSFMAFLSFAINVAVGFWSSPFIVSKLGAEAHGFSHLGGNFTTYMSLITIAINSFAARYISISLQKKDIEQANKYFTSIFFTNLLILLIVFFPCVYIVYNVDTLFSVSDELVNDVRVQWSIMFASWMIALAFKVFSTSTFAKNRLDINHGLTAVSNIIRFVAYLVLFLCFTPKLWYIGIATILGTLFVDIGHLITKKKLMSEVSIRLKYFDLKSLKTLFFKGVWNSFNQLSAMLINGLSLLITNLTINSVVMGLYSISQTLPTYLQSFMYTVCDLFNPNLTIFYANGRNDKVRDGIKFAMKFNSVLLMVPLMGFLVYGLDFYRLWQYSLNDSELKMVTAISVLVILPMISSVITQPLLTVNTITARLKVPVFVNAGIGVLNIVVVLILVNTTNLGVYAIAGVNSILLIIRNFLFYPVYSAKNLSLPASTFYPTIMRGMVCGVVVFGFLYITHLFITIGSWIKLVFYAVLFGGIAEVLVFLLLLNRDEKKTVLNTIKNKVLRRRT